MCETAGQAEFSIKTGICAAASADVCVAESRAAGRFPGVAEAEYRECTASTATAHAGAGRAGRRTGRAARFT